MDSYSEKLLEHKEYFHNFSKKKCKLQKAVNFGHFNYPALPLPLKNSTCIIIVDSYSEKKNIIGTQGLLPQLQAEKNVNFKKTVDFGYLNYPSPPLPLKTSSCFNGFVQ